MTNKYIINARKWFEKVNGNTYHTIQIIDINKNEVLHESEHIIYGYGEQYRQTAYSKLKELKKVKEEDKHNHEKNNKRFFWNVCDVQRKKDLFNWGF